MTPALIDESALPHVRPTPGAVSDGAVALRRATEAVRSAARDAAAAWAGIGSVLRAPGATDALPRAMDDAGATADGLASAGGAVAAALEAFADEVSTVRRRRRALLADVEELRARVAASDSDDVVPDEYRADNDDLLGRARRLHTRWDQAQEDLSQAVRTQVGGGSLLLPGPDGGTFAPPLLMVDLAGVAQGFDDALRLPMLAALAADGPGALEHWAAEHPDDARRLLDEPPAAGSVRRWWSALDGDERTALVTGLSAVIGNLNGVRYADRGRANRHTLEVELPKAQAAREVFLARFRAGEPLLASEVDEYERVLERARALEALDRTLAEASPANPRSIVALTLGQPPLAAVAVGDLDTASHVTVNVPGMGNTVADSMEAWAGGAENLLVEQRKVAARASADRNLATVAWIGYDTPAMPPSIEVLGSTKAEAGARRLTAFTEGVAGGRGWSHGEHLSVVAHSYGTTTATLAASRAPVSDLVLLASAGVDPRVPDVHALDVPAGHVWASQAKDDLVANVGRGAVELPRPGFGGDQPIDTGNPFTANRSLVATLPSTHRLNPGDPDWGGRTFSSNDSVVDGVPFAGSDGHGATPAVEAALQGSEPEASGYLDAGTTSLRNTAATSLGYTPDGERIP
ncbi:alpha/beta hydrolase [Curtobacterium sp. ME26]|uniref:alpha/beta hydrolase n=1 Tax=Curtobacterium sp. ME26 TaxID=2744254 RepID=UPI0015F3F2D4|nr:alpha/beta hydrolase [Curtobacterium sp. ME26]